MGILFSTSTKRKRGIVGETGYDKLAERTEPIMKAREDSISDLSSIQYYNSINPVALIAGSFWSIPGILIGSNLLYFHTSHITAIFMGLLYLSVSYRLINFAINKSANTNILNTLSTLSSYLNIAISGALGAILAIQYSLPICILLGWGLPTNFIKICLVVSISITFAIVAHFIGNKLFDNIMNLAMSSYTFTSIILCSSFGKSFGPAGWLVGLITGSLFIGSSSAILLHNIAKRYEHINNFTKILTPIYSIISVYIGNAVGAIAAWHIKPVISGFDTALYSACFGGVAMLIGSYIGFKVSNKPEFNKADLNNNYVRHTLYKAAFCLPFLFWAEMTGAILGLTYFKSQDVILNKAYSLLIGMGSYTLAMKFPKVVEQASHVKNTIRNLYQTTVDGSFSNYISSSVREFINGSVLCSRAC